MRKKGLLFTLGLLLVSLTLFSLSIVTFHDTQSMEEIFIDASALDRLHDVYSSIDNSLKGIFVEESGIAITISPTEDYISIEENLSNLKAATFKTKMDEFKAFIEMNFSEATLNIDEVKNSMTLLINPYDINYTHPDGYGTSKKTGIVPAQINFNSYTSYIYSPSVNITGITWGNYTSGSITVRITAEDSAGNYFTDQKSVGTAGISVNLLTGSPVSISMDSAGKLEITNTADSMILSRTTIGLSAAGNQKLKVTYPDNVISLNYDNFDLSKEAGPILAW